MTTTIITANEADIATGDLLRPIPTRGEVGITPLVAAPTTMDRTEAATAIGETAREETALKNRRVDPSKAITAVAARGRIRALRAIVLRRVIAAAARGLRDHMDREGAGRAIVVIGRAVRAILAGAIGMGLRGGEIDMMIMMRKYRGLLPYLKLRGVVVIRWCSSKALTLNSF